MPRNKKSPIDSLERKVIETPTLSRLDVGIDNEGFDSIPSPSFFYIDDSSSWMDHRRGGGQKRFTESWIELDRAYSCGSSTADRRCSRRAAGCVVYLLVALSVIGFAAIVSAILYMEVFHKMDYEWHPLKTKVFDENINQLPIANSAKANSGFASLNVTASPLPPETTPKVQAEILNSSVPPQTRPARATTPPAVAVVDVPTSPAVSSALPAGAVRFAQSLPPAAPPVDSNTRLATHSPTSSMPLSGTSDAKADHEAESRTFSLA